MSVHIVHASGRLQATVEGDFDFAASRRLLLDVKKCWTPDMCELVVLLRHVTHATSCAIGAMMLLSELAGSNFHVRIEQCSVAVGSLFESGLLDRYFPVAALDGCRGCLAGQVALCRDEERALPPGKALAA